MQTHKLLPGTTIDVLLVRLLAVLLGAAALALALPFVLTALAGGAVSNCSNDADFSAKLAGGGLVTFSCGASPRTIVLSSTKTINQNTTIDGGNLITLSGGSSLRQFIVSAGAALTLSNLTLADGFTSGDGGAISSTGTLYISHSQLLRNHAAGFGGAIDSLYRLTITGSVLAHNTADGWGGAIANGDVADFIDSRIAVTGSILASNQGFNGGAIFNRFITTLNNTTLNGNIANGGGGAVENWGLLTVYNAMMNDNTASGNGGAIENADGLWLFDSSVSGNHASDGGGVYSGYSDLATISNTLLSGNVVTGSGGAIYNRNNLTLSGSTLSSNQAGYGGGLQSDDGATTITATTFASNAAAYGGGIYNLRFFRNPIDQAYGVLTLTNSTLSGNVASSAGGGLYNFGSTAYSATALIRGSTFSANHAADGGGLYGAYQSAALVNTTLSSNTAITGGGLKLDSDSNGMLMNVTLSANGAMTGGGWFVAGGAGNFLTVTNTIIAASPSGGNCAGHAITATFNISSDATCALPGGTNHNALDPLLDAFGNYGGPTFVLMLKPASPALNSGTAAGAPATDQRGVLRPQGGGYDIGAVERRPGDLDVPLTPRLDLPLLER